MQELLLAKRAQFGPETDPDELTALDGEVAAVVANASSGYGAGYQAYPFYGYDYDMGWDAGSPYYDLPYSEDEVSELERFDYERLGS